MRMSALVLLAMMFGVLPAGASAPSSIADSIITIEFYSISFAVVTTETALLRPDGTFQDLQRSDGFAGGAPSTLAPTNGTYTYVPSTTQPDEGIVTWTTSMSQYTTALTFLTPTSGTVDSLLQTFVLYPRIVVSGAGNVSNNSWVMGNHPSISGFVIEGTSPRWTLIRGAGPSLAQFNVNSPVAAPQIAVYSGANAIETPASWCSDPNLVAGFEATFSLVGAFQFSSGSADCAGLYLLNPGAYTVEGATSGAVGTLLTEVYILPFGS